MCLACLAAATRRSADSEDDRADWGKPAPSRFAAAAEWADDPPDDENKTEPQASGRG